MVRKRTRVLMTALAAGALALAGQAPAHAADDSGTAEDNWSCWIDFATDESLCVGEGEDLVAAVRDEAGVELSAPTGTIIGDREFEQPAVSRGSTAMLATVVGVLYDDINYGGGTLVFTGIPEGCTTGWAYGYTSLSSVGWNDRASSMRGYQGCRTAVFENENYVGSQFGYTPGNYFLGVMNDEASSWRLAP
ncbi:hypothetical protein [Agromyces sp. SYSU T00194]|uniref:hypothetical protein n=1 Tax=Agromyces chitinivorans TaxID=3158560 RepID=UPI003398121F